jgi:hypothetical protein
MVLGSAAESTNLMVKPPVPLPGGLGLHPVITSVTRTQDLVTVQWFGLQGPFQLLHSPAATSNAWQEIGQPTFRNRVTTPAPGDNGFFRVLSGTPVSTAPTGGTLNYIGATACIDCHEETVQQWAQTPHARALDSLKAIGQQNNAACLTCHSVGFETPLGFQSEATTAHLAGVQCESCHGPAANHVAIPRDFSVRPKVTVASEVCGGCHNFHHPTYDEWKLSGHAVIDPEVSASTLQQGPSRMMTCGPCHSGAVRTALLGSLGRPAVELPNRQDAAHFPVTCAVCHDSHMNTPHSYKLPNTQVRNPLFSLQNYSYATSTNVASFAAQYDPSVQLCAQCHNMRGARWQDTGRPPHHSPQYNLLVGQGAYDLGRPILTAHATDLANQCVHCHSAHLPAEPGGTAPAAGHDTTNYIGHTFQVALQSCAECHISTNAAERAISRTQQNTHNQIASVKALLDQWATNKAPADLQAKYGTLAWEYTVPGALSNPDGESSLRGPTSAEQANVPDAIKQARLNLYLVEHDGSFGVHNGQYARYLLNVAQTNVTAELNKPE